MTKFHSPGLLVLFSVLLFLTGCASPAQKEAVVVRNLPVDIRHEKSVSVRTQGGRDTSAMSASSMSNSDLKKALEDSLIATNLFARVVQSESSDYQLSVSVVSMSNPAFGASFTVDLEAAWSLVELTTGAVVMREVVKSSYTATMSDALVGVTRFRLAVEGAVKDNIRQGLLLLSNLEL